MTQAAKQCREYVERTYPGTPISRFACRNTASGGISQHSAYNGYDSNALDIFGPDKSASEADQRYIQRIVDDLTAHLTDWSIRAILWKDGGAHENHAHVDFYPMITMKKWCGGPETPTWKYSAGHEPATVTTREPEPENGRYYGGDVNCPWSPPCDSHYNREEWGENSKGVCNVPEQQRPAIDWSVAEGAIKVSDEFRDDYDRLMSDGRYHVNEWRKAGSPIVTYPKDA